MIEINIKQVLIVGIKDGRYLVTNASRYLIMQIIFLQISIRSFYYILQYSSMKIYLAYIMFWLGVVHNYWRFRKRTNRTLFLTPLPPPPRRTYKMLNQHFCWYIAHIVHINKFIYGILSPNSIEKCCLFYKRCYIWCQHFRFSEMHKFDLTPSPLVQRFVRFRKCR